MELGYRKATLRDLPKIVEIYNQIIPSRLATADLTPITVTETRGRDKNYGIYYSSIA